MTEEELNRLEAVVRERAALGDIDPEPSLSLIALARVGLAVQPRPIAEAPKDGAVCLVIADYATTPEWGEGQWIDDAWLGYDYENGIECMWVKPTHFIPLSALPKPGGKA